MGVMCPAKSKIFRPWDVKQQNQQTLQDSQAVEQSAGNKLDSNVQKVNKSVVVADKNQEDFAASKIQLSSPLPISNNELVSLTASGADQTQSDLMMMMMHPSIGSTLPGDAFFLDGLVHQGYALEEYARVLGQEHRAKVLNARKQRPKKYKCPHCDVGFSNNGQLKGHIRIHTGERPFRCDEKDCGKTFTRNEELTRHKRIHSGLRPFPCTHCGKRFGRKDHLKKHSRTHLQSATRGLYTAVPVMLPLDAWTNPYHQYVASVPVQGVPPQSLPAMYGF